MGQRGPRPKPAALKFLAGNPGKRPVGETGGRGRTRKGAPDRPAEVTGEAAAEWDRLIPEMEAAGLLAVTDRGILAAYCCAYAGLLAARHEITTHGWFVTEPVQTSKGELLGNKVRPNPAAKMFRELSALVQKLGAELGLTPASRSRLEGGGGEAAPRENRVSQIRDRIQAARNGGLA